MTITASGVDKRLDIGKVFQQTIEVLQRNFASFGLLTLLLAAGPHLISAFGQIAFKGSPIVQLITGIVGIAGLVLGPMQQGALMYGTVQDLNGSPASMQDCFRVGSKRWLPLLGLEIVSGIGIGIGFMLLVVPGVILALRWAVSAPALIMEGRGITDAMDRSVSLTKGRRGGIFLLLLVVWIAAAIIEGAIFAIMGGFGGLQALAASKANPSLTILLLGPIITFVFNILVWPLIASLFHQLRVTREGATPESLAEVFA